MSNGPNVRTGFVTQLGMALEEAVENASECGFDFVEVMMDGENHREDLDGRREEVLDLFEEAGIDRMVHLPFTVDIGSPNEHVRHGSMEEIRACIETAASLGVEKAVLHASSDAWSAAWEDEEIRDIILDSIRDIDGSAVDHGVEVCVENVPGGFFTTHDFPRLFDETEASMCLDTGHARIDGMDGEEMGVFVEDYRERISHVHLNDTRVDDEDSHLPFGAGNLDVEPVLAPLRTGWKGTLSLEVFTPSWDYIEMSRAQLEERLVN